VERGGKEDAREPPRRKKAHKGMQPIRKGGRGEQGPPLRGSQARQVDHCGPNGKRQEPTKIRGEGTREKVGPDAVSCQQPVEKKQKDHQNIKGNSTPIPIFLGDRMVGGGPKIKSSG